MNSKKVAAERVRQIANEISAYLAERDGAADTFDGLVSWWLFRQRLPKASSEVRQALLYLQKNQLISKRVLADGTVLYSATPVKSQSGKDGSDRLC